MLTAAFLFAFAASENVSPRAFGQAGEASKRYIFAPEQFFDRDETTQTNGPVLKGRYNLREGVVPTYAVAIAFICIPKGQSGCNQRLEARALRFTGSDEANAAWKLQRDMAKQGINTKLDAKTFLRTRNDLGWFTADVLTCPSAFEAFDAVRTSDWSPQLDSRLMTDETREKMGILLHPPLIEVTMQDDLMSEVTSQSSPESDGPSGALQVLMEKLEPCWKPSTAKKPWER